MQKYVKVYLDHFNYVDSDFTPCERCGGRGVEIHHIYGRGNGKDVISNLMCVCRTCHTMAHNEEVKKHAMQEIHDKHLLKWKNV